MRLRKLLVCALAAASLAACTPDSNLGMVGSPDVDVDTPALRALKAEIGVEPCPTTTATRATGDRALPDLELPCLGGGRAINLSRLRGPLVITFWASWCGPCRRELPIFERFHDKYAGRVAVLGIDTNDVHPDGALELVRASHATFPHLADTATAVAETGLRVGRLPTLALVDEEGRLVHIEAREIESLAELEQLAATHLDIDLAGATK